MKRNLYPQRYLDALDGVKEKKSKAFIENVKCHHGGKIGILPKTLEDAFCFSAICLPNQFTMPKRVSIIH